MNEYIFRMPASTPEMTFAALTAYMDSHPWFPYANGGRYTKIGATVTLTYRGVGSGAIDVRLYGVKIARIMTDAVYFPVHHDAHAATTYWLEKIVCDNGIGRRVGRIRRRKSDPLIPVTRGLTGPLAINWDRGMLIEGNIYPVNHARIAASQDEAGRREAELTFRNAHPDTWAKDLDTTVPGGGMPDYRLAQPERAVEWGIRQEAARAANAERLESR